MLKVTNLQCNRADKVLLRNLSFTLQPGQALQICGPNGIGKTTLLRSLAGLLQPTFGTVEHGDLDFCYIGHKASLHPDLTLFENLYFLFSLMPIAQHVDANLILRTLEYFHLQNKIHHKFAELSMGQAQKASLARLVCTSAKIWLLDEPLANLDHEACDLLLALCTQHLKNGGIIVFASHNVLDLKNTVTQTLQLDAWR